MSIFIFIFFKWVFHLCWQKSSQGTFILASLILGSPFWSLERSSISLMEKYCQPAANGKEMFIVLGISILKLARSWPFLSWALLFSHSHNLPHCYPQLTVSSNIVLYRQRVVLWARENHNEKESDRPSGKPLPDRGAAEVPGLTVSAPPVWQTLMRSAGFMAVPGRWFSVGVPLHFLSPISREAICLWII